MIFSRIPKNAYNAAIVCAFAAAVLIALKTPLTVLFIGECDALSVTAFVHLGILPGMLLIAMFGRKTPLIDPARHLRKNDTVYLIIIILAGTAASFLINTGLRMTNAATGSVLSNFVIVATALFAFFLFREKISKRLWVGILLITLGVLALSITDISSLSLTPGALLILGSAVCYGFSNNIMKKVSGRNPVETTIVRAAGVSLLSFALMPLFGSEIPPISAILPLMTIGFLTSGLGFLFTLYAQRQLGAAKTGALTGIQPFLAIIASFVIFSELPSPAFIAALILVIPGMYFVITKNTGKTKSEPGAESKREDAEYIKAISDEKKTGIKNQLTSFGFVITAMFFVMMALSVFGSGTKDAIDVFSSEMLVPGLVLGISLLVTGIILLILGKRVLTAVTFIFMVPHISSFVILGNNPILSAVSGIFSLIFSLILLTSNDPQKYAFAAVNALLGAAFISYIFNDVVCGIIVGSASVFLVWLSIVCGAGKLQHSIAKHLAEDGDMTFGRCGAVIGFLLLAKIMATDLIYDYFTDTSFYLMDSVLALGFIYTGLVVLVGVLLLFIGKRQAGALFFFGGALVFLLEQWCDGLFSYLAVIFSLLFGILIVLRGRSLVLPAILWIGEAFILLLYEQLVFFPEVQTAMLLMTLGSAVVELYLAFAVFSEKPKLPVF